MKRAFGARARSAVLILTASLWIVGCSMEDGEAPAVTGPSTFGISVSASAVPDRLPRDGTSQSVITLTVRDADNRPFAGQRVTLGVIPTAAVLSTSEVTTDSNGQATFTLTAPPASAIAGSVVTIHATPVSNVSGSAVPRTIEISLAGAVNTTTPTPSFTVTPASPEVGQVTSFDASATTDEGVPCLDNCTYTWTFGDEAVRTGRVQTHGFQTPGVHSVSLTVADQSGSSATLQRNVTVTAAARPTVTGITVTPTPPLVGQAASFTAAFTVAPNHRITSFVWQWGDGTTTTTANASTTHTFNSSGSFVVTVTATDDLNQSASASTTVVLGSGITASFTFSPDDPKTTDTVQFDASASTTSGGATITKYTWNFGDGTVVESSDPTISHAFPNNRTYVVRLTVTDSTGRTGTTTESITIDTP